MHVHLLVVTSVDGRTTHGDEPGVHGWTSKADWDYFVAQRAAHEVLIMGRSTYEAVQSYIVPGPALRRIVMTRHPQRFSASVIAGQLEFTDEPPKSLIQRLVDEGHSSVLLATDQGLAGKFLAEGLVDELWRTVEPVLFGSGKMISSELLDCKLQLLQVRTLGECTVLHKYKVLSA